MRSARARANDIHMCVWRHVNSILLLRSNAHYADVTKDMIHFTSLSNDRLLPFLVFLVLFLGSHFHYVHLSSLSQSEFKCEWSRKCVRSCVCVCSIPNRISCARTTTMYQSNVHQPIRFHSPDPYTIINASNFFSFQ